MAWLRPSGTSNGAQAVETLVLGPAAFEVAATYALAEAIAGARSEQVDCLTQRNLSITIEVTALAGAGNIFVAPRSSGKAAPSTATPLDWSRMNRTANIDTATGIDSSLPLIEKIAVDAVGRHTLDLPATNRFVSLVVWSDVVGMVGNTYIYKAA